MIRVLIITANPYEMVIARDQINKYIHDDLYGAEVGFGSKANFNYFSRQLVNNVIISAPDLHINIYPYDYVDRHPDCIRGAWFDYCMLQSDASDRFEKELFSGMRMRITDFTDLKTIIHKTIFYSKPQNDIFNPSENFKQIITKRLNSLGIIKDQSNTPTIKKVIFDGPATIVFWSDGTKTVSKAAKNDCIDAEKGLAMAISKKIIGNYSNFKKILRENGREPENLAWRYKFSQRYHDIMKHLR